MNVADEIHCKLWLKQRPAVLNVDSLTRGCLIQTNICNPAAFWVYLYFHRLFLHFFILELNHEFIQKTNPRCCRSFDAGLGNECVFPNPSN